MPVRRFHIPRATEYASPSAVFSTYMWGWITAAYGLCLVVGGWDRFQARSYYALAMIPGGPYVVGGVLIGCGVGVVVSQRWASAPVRNLMLIGAIVVYLSIAGSIAYSAIFQPSAGLGGGVLLAGIALQLVVLLRLRPRRLHDDAPTG
jgi:hypothetical protein